MFLDLYFVVVFKLIYLSYIQTKETNNSSLAIAKNTNSNDSTTSDLNIHHVVKFSNKIKLKCSMYKICQLDLAIKNIFDLDQLVFESSDSKVFKLKSVGPCDSKNCPTLADFWFNETEKNFQNSFTIYSVKIEAILIGKASLQIFEKEKMILLTHTDIVVTQPQRIIDIVFIIWVWTFGVLISLLMGVLLDKDALVKIVKMPKAIMIGFSCQYIIMPLV